MRERLSELRDLTTADDFLLLSNVTLAYLNSEAPYGPRAQRYQEHLDAQLRGAIAELEEGMEKLAKQDLLALPNRIEATTRDLTVAIDIKAEG